MSPQEHGAAEARRELALLIFVVAALLAMLFVASGCAVVRPTADELGVVAQDARVLADELAHVTTRTDMSDVAELASRIASNLETMKARRSSAR